MDAQTIRTAADIYEFVQQLKIECNRNGRADLTARFDDAFTLGSSGLEILGAIRKIFSEERFEIERLLGRNGKNGVDAVISFVDGAFGR